MDWGRASSDLRRDHRWKSLEALTSEQKEKIFNDHCSELRSRKRLVYTRLLDAVPGVSLLVTHAWTIVCCLPSCSVRLRSP